MSTAQSLSAPIADADIWLDVVCAAVERAETFKLAADELGVSVEMLQRWVLRMTRRRSTVRKP